ncbi:MAG: hypothetical protein ABI304_05715 [Rudaea sp.]
MRITNRLPEEEAQWPLHPIAGLDESARHWMSGYAAGLAARAEPR